MLLGDTALFKEMSQRWRVVGNSVSNLTGPGFEPELPLQRRMRHRLAIWPRLIALFDKFINCNKKIEKKIGISYNLPKLPYFQKPTFDIHDSNNDSQS